MKRKNKANFTFSKESKEKLVIEIRIEQTDSLIGGTDINSALLEALTIATHAQQRNNVNKDKDDDDDVQPMVFFLTDGHPTSGETDPSAIAANVEKANSAAQVPLFCLAFGRQADFDSLKASWLNCMLLRPP